MAPVIAVFGLFPEPLMRAVGGRGYQGAAELVLPLGIAMALMSFSNAFLLYGCRRAAAVLGGAFLADSNRGGGC